MINLIPPPAKRALRREYWTRITTVWLWLVVLVLAVSAIFAAPSFVLVSTQLDAYEQQLQAATAAADEQDQLAAAVQQSNSEAAAAYQLGTVTAFMPHYDAITGVQPADVTLQNFIFNREEGVITNIVVSGSATTRRSLTSFSEALVASPYFVSADVPLADLAAQQDLSFSLTIEVAGVNE